MGPTATGKSEVAVRVAAALAGEIVGCDAVQVYRGLDAGTGKPDPGDRRKVPHHLIDVADPNTDFSMAEFVRRAERLVEQIHARGGVPLVVGGTGLYLRGLLRGIVSAPPREAGLRRRLRAMAARRGPAALHRWLHRLDAASARRLAPGDTQRIVRALELALIGPATWSERLRVEGSWSSPEERYDTLKVGLRLEREELYRRIEARVDRFFEGGLVREARRLLDAGTRPEANALKAIGYREVLAALREGRDPDTVREEVKRNTRRYAKRQLTWFRREPGVVWLDAATGTEQLARSIIDLWRAR